jgi:hypothetical protein
MSTIKTISLAISTLLLACLLGTTSCKKNNSVNYGVPSISMVSQPLDPAQIDTGSFTQWVIIYGTNLASAQSVTFNDQAVPYADIYASDTSVTVQIPRAIPQNVSNTVKVTTKGGTATYNFTVLIPALQITDMFNEYTPVGDTLTIVGQNFDLYGLDTTATTVTFTGGQTASVTSGTATTLNVVVPSGAQPGPITVKGPAPDNVNQATTAWYMDNRNFLVSMTNFTGWNGSAYLSSGPNPAPINGPYFLVNKTFQGGYAWDPWCSNYSNIPAALVNDPTQYVNYALKFEMNAVAVPEALYMCFNNGNFKNYLYDPSGTNTYPFTTNGKWETFTVPLSSWGNLADFTYTGSMIMEFMCQGGTAAQADFAICNYRLVPIN